MRVPRTAHVLPATPLAYNPCPCTLRHPRGLVSPGSCTGPSSMLSRRPPLPWQVRDGDPQAASAALSDAVRRVRRRSARRRRLLQRAPSFHGALTLPAGRGRPCAPPPSLGLLTPPPSPPPGRCRQHRLMRASPLRRVVTVGPCLYRVLYVRVACVRPRRVRGTARDVQCLKVCLCIIHK